MQFPRDFSTFLRRRERLLARGAVSFEIPGVQIKFTKADSSTVNLLINYPNDPRSRPTVIYRLFYLPPECIYTQLCHLFKFFIVQRLIRFHASSPFVHTCYFRPSAAASSISISVSKKDVAAIKFNFFLKNTWLPI